MHAARRPVLAGAKARGGAGSRGQTGGRPSSSTSSASSFTSVFAASSLFEDYSFSVNLVLLFVYGIIGGALSCLFFFFFVFHKVRSKLDHTIRKKAIKHQALEEVAKAAAVVPAAKVETLCKVVCYDDGVVGEVIQCRALLFSDTMVLYKVEQLTTDQDHRQAVTKETLLGKINRNCAVTSAERLSKYHRHLNLFSRYSPIKGKVTILSSKDPVLPLFMDDPAARLQERLDEMRRTREEARRHRRNDEASAADPFAHCTDDGSADGGLASRGSRAWTQKMTAQLEAVLMMTKAGRAKFAARPGETELDKRLRLRKEIQKLLVPHGRRFGSGLGFTQADKTTNNVEATSLEAPVRQWRTIAIKFPNRRVNERWFNLLQGTSHTLQWQYYLNHLPNMDVLNLLLARLFFENNSTDSLHDLLRDKFQKNLSNASNNFGDKLKGDIRLDGLTVGGEMPLLSNVSDCTVDQTGELNFDFDLLYRGGLTLTIRLANFSYRDLHVPDLLFHIKVLELSGRLHFNVGPPPTQKFWLGCHRAPDLRLEFTQEVASHEGILNVVLNILPDMSTPMTNVVKTLLFDDMVFPSFDDFPWPVVDGPEKEREEKARKAEEEERAAKAEEAVAAIMQERQRGSSSSTAKPDKASRAKNAQKRGEDHVLTSPVSVDSASLASTVMSNMAARGTGERSPVPRPVTAEGRPAEQPVRMTPSALNASVSKSGAPATSSKNAKATEAARRDEEGLVSTPVSLFAQNSESPLARATGQTGGRSKQVAKEEDASMNSARRRRVGTVIRVSALAQDTGDASYPLPVFASSASSSTGYASARAEAAKTYPAETPIEYVSSGQSAVSASIRTSRAVLVTPTSSHAPQSVTNSTRASLERTRITVGAAEATADDEEAVVFRGGSFASVASSTRASRSTNR